MLAMLHGGWSRSSVRFVSETVSFCRAQVSVTTNDVIAWSLGEVSYSTVVWVCFAVQGEREKR
jgi:hypothetical protein